MANLLSRDTHATVTLTVPLDRLAGFLLNFTKENPNMPLLSAEDALLYVIEDGAETLFLTDQSHASSGVSTHDCGACAPHIHAFAELQNALSVLGVNYGTTDDPLADALFSPITSAVDRAFTALAGDILDDYATRNGETRAPQSLGCTCGQPDTLVCDVHGVA